MNPTLFTEFNYFFELSAFRVVHLLRNYDVIGDIIMMSSEWNVRVVRSGRNPWLYYSEPQQKFSGSYWIKYIDQTYIDQVEKYSWENV